MMRPCVELDLYYDKVKFAYPRPKCRVSVYRTKANITIIAEQGSVELLSIISANDTLFSRAFHSRSQHDFRANDICMGLLRLFALASFGRSTFRFARGVFSPGMNLSKKDDRKGWRKLATIFFCFLHDRTALGNHVIKFPYDCFNKTIEVKTRKVELARLTFDSRFVYPLKRFMCENRLI